MKQMGLRYFSSLSPEQKDRVVSQLIILREDMGSLDYNLALSILQQSKPIEFFIKERNKIEEKLKGQQVMIHESLKIYGWLPLNVGEIIKKS